MSDTFDTLADAIAAGYSLTRHGVKHDTYRHCAIISTDTSSGADEINYSFGMAACVPEKFSPTGFLREYSPKMARTRSVWLRLEKNKIHRPGSFSIMYHPDDYQTGLQAARDWIDQYFIDHPEAAIQAERIDRDRAASDARHSAKQAARHKKVSE